MKKLFTLTTTKNLILAINFLLLSLTVMAQQGVCWVTSDYDINDNRGKGTATICITGKSITVNIPEYGLYKLHTELERGFVDSATRWYYSEKIGDFANENNNFLFYQFGGTKRLYISTRGWYATLYNVRKMGTPAPTKFEKRYTGAVVEYLDSAEKSFKARNDSAEVYRLAVLDTVRTDADELRPYLMNASSPRHLNGELASGKVTVEFYVESNGSITNITPVSVKSKSDTEYEDSLISNEAVRVINSIGKLTPGTVKGVPTRMRMTQSFIFGY